MTLLIVFSVFQPQSCGAATCYSKRLRLPERPILSWQRCWPGGLPPFIMQHASRTFSNYATCLRGWGRLFLVLAPILSPLRALTGLEESLSGCFRIRSEEGRVGDEGGRRV